MLGVTKEQKRILKTVEELTEFVSIANHFFPDLMKWFAHLKDPRNLSYITYPQSVLLATVMGKYVGGVVTMRQMNEQFNTDAAIANISKICGNIPLHNLPDWQTVNNYLERLDPEELQRIRTHMVRALTRSNNYKNYKFQGSWPLILDGTELVRFSERHCDSCLSTVVKHEDGSQTTYYYHKVLEAKIVLGPGLVLSLGTEFIENETPNVSKQDCELNAAYRLLPRIHAEFPNMVFTVLGDSLYSAEPFMNLCASYKWNYLLNMKDGRQKTVAEDFYELLVEKEDDQFYSVVRNICGKEQGTAHFVNHMELISDKTEIFNVIQYNFNCPNSNGQVSKHFVFVTNLDITKQNAEKIVVAARMRWNIEEAFCAQKTGIFEIVHLCSFHPVAMKNHYMITQICDILLQLCFAYSKILMATNSSIKAFSAGLKATLVKCTFTETDISYITRKTKLHLQKSVKIPV